MLTFEITRDGDVVEIHANQDGLSTLIRCLEELRVHGDHIHLMTQDWGGQELTQEKQGPENRLVNHVKLMLWA